MFLNATSASGNHTSGETGRSTCTIGSNSLRIVGLTPMRIPAGIATAALSVKPIAIRPIDASTWSPMPGVPSTLANA